MIRPKVSVAILNWNGKSWLEQFLPYLKESTYPNIEVVIIDNGSTDDSVAYVKEIFPDFKVFVWDKNYGFAEGYNLILNHIESPYLVLLNSDVEVSPNWLEPLVEVMEKDPMLISVQPKVLAHHDKTLFEYAGAAGGFMDYLCVPFCRGRIFDTVEKDLGQYDTFQEVFWATGACCILRTEKVKEIGLFQGEFFAHWEEIDFCWRAKNLGYKVGCEPRSVVYHVGGGALPPSSPFKTYLNVRNSLAAMLLNLPGLQVVPKIFIRMIIDGVFALKSLAGGDVKSFFSVLRAHFHFYAKIPFWIKKRKETYRGKLQGKRLAVHFPNSVVFNYFFSAKKTYQKLVEQNA